MSTANVVPMSPASAAKHGMCSQPNLVSPSCGSSSMVMATAEELDTFDEDCEEIDEFDASGSFGLYSEEYDDDDSYTTTDAAGDEEEDTETETEGSYGTSDMMSSAQDTMGTSEFSESDWSSSSDEDYDNLMAEMPIALGRKAGAPPEARAMPPRQPSSPKKESQASGGAPPPPAELPNIPMQLPTFICGGQPQAGGAKEGLEGLAMLQDIRSELEKVGRMIVANKDGEKFLQRAHILASINMLADNVPSCVLEHLGQEIREWLRLKKDGGNERGGLSRKPSTVNLALEDDDMTDASDLSDVNMIEDDASGSSDGLGHIELNGMIEDMVAQGLPIGPLGLPSESSHHSDHLPCKNSGFQRSLMHLSGEEKKDGESISRNSSMDLSRRSSMSSRRSSMSSRRDSVTNARRESMASASASRQDAMSIESSRNNNNKVPEPTTRVRKSISFSSFRRLSSDCGSSYCSGSRRMSNDSGPEFRGLGRKSSRDSVSARSLSQTFTSCSNLSHLDSPRRMLRRRNSCISSVVSHTMNSDAFGFRILPSVLYFEGALLFVDISGFTRLSTRLDPENLSKVINSYFDKIVGKVFEFDGDIQKFAGDALFAEWRASRTMSIEQCVEAAAACASSMVKDCADFPVVALGGILDAAETQNQGSRSASLNVHCGLGVGEMAGIHVGDSELRREYLYIGNPISQATHACDRASLGQVVASPRVYDMLAWAGVLDETTLVTGETQHVLAERGLSKLNLDKIKDSCLSLVRNAKSRGITDHVDGLQPDALIEYRRLMSLYVHPVVVSNDVAAKNGFKSSRSNQNVQERHREEAELRSVYCLFINPLLKVNLKGDIGSDKNDIELLNDIMTMVNRELSRYNGHLRQFIVDDKGVVLIATFGLRGSTFPNMVSERALPATIVLHNALKMELGIDSRIGATFGDAYCGMVGADKRHEYAVMGPSVNLAARLMSQPGNPGILVDNAVRKLACKSYGFNALDPVEAKGYRDPVPIFEPLSPLKRTWGRIEPNFVGREKELKQIAELVTGMVEVERVAPKIALVSASGGMGKSTFVVHALEKIRNEIGAGQQGLVMLKHACRGCDSQLPFSTIRPLMLRLLALRDQRAEDDKAKAEGTKQKTKDKSSQKKDATDSDEPLSETRSAEIIGQLCRDLHVAPSFVTQVKNVLLGDSGTSGGGINADVPLAVDAVAAFVARAFRMCTEHAKLAMVVLDDIHEADEWSWQVMREIFETADNVLFVGATSTSTDSLRVDDDFWEDLYDVYMKNGRFIQMELGSLNQEEIELMTMKTLGLQQKDVTAELLNEVLVESGGMPSFANAILEGIKRRSTDTDLRNEADASLNEIILHRVDSLDTSVRNVLNVGAIMGTSFTLGEVVAAMKEKGDTKEEELRSESVDSLKVAVREGILFTGETQDGGEAKAAAAFDDDDTQFSFHRDVWRTTLLGLMLDSRKRDVHRKIAMSIESTMDLGSATPELRKKLCGHWKASGDTMKAASTALSTGKFFANELGLPQDSIRLYESTLKMWGWDRNATDRAVAGFSSMVLDFISPTDLSHIISLMVALGRSYTLVEEHKEAVSAYEASLRILQVAKASAQLKDRSVIFPAFIGLSDAIADGHIEQDVFRRYEQTMIRRYLQETRMHGRLIHHIHALYLQIDFYSRQGELDKAIAVQSVIKNLYKVDKHSQGLRRVYGKDSGALSFSLSAFWHLVQGESKQGLRTCRYVFKELLPKIETDFNQSFALMYPLVLVLKETGYCSEAGGFFDKVVADPYVDEASSKKKSENPLVIHEPLKILLDLSCSKAKPEKFDQYLCWASDPERMCVGTYVNKRLGRLGRCSDSISAEICALLAAHLEEGPQRANLIGNGNMLAHQAMCFNRRHGLKVAQKQVQQVLSKLRMLKCETNLVEW